MPYWIAIPPLVGLVALFIWNCGRETEWERAKRQSWAEVQRARRGPPRPGKIILPGRR